MRLLRRHPKSPECLPTAPYIQIPRGWVYHEYPREMRRPWPPEAALLELHFFSDPQKPSTFFGERWGWPVRAVEALRRRAREHHLV